MQSNVVHIQPYLSTANSHWGSRVYCDVYADCSVTNIYAFVTPRVPYLLPVSIGLPTDRFHAMYNNSERRKFDPAKFDSSKSANSFEWPFRLNLYVSLLPTFRR